jgi:putative transcriptional regulator
MIKLSVDVQLAKRKMSLTELAECMGFTLANASLLKNGKVKALKFATLDKLCRILECQPGDLLSYQEG